MEHSILFVDDEKNILTAMKRIFHASPFNLFFAESGEEALKLLKESSVSVIISDMKMPGMSGIDFLKASEDYSPDSIRIILSGYSDIHDILSAVNEGHVHNYLTKPWDNERLKIVLYNATISYEKNVQVKEMAEELKNKNSQLESMNANLEEIVEEKSKVLALQNKILLNMLKEPEADRNITLCLQAIKEIIGDGHVYLAFNEDLSLTPSLKNFGLSPPKRILDVKDNISKPSYVNEYFLLPLELRNKVVCHVIAYPIFDKNTSFIPSILSFSNIIKLIIQQQSHLNNSVSLMDSIDDILEGI